MVEAEVQQIVDGEHVRLLVIGYYVQAGVCAFQASIGLIYFAMAGLMATMPTTSSSSRSGLPPDFFPIFFAAFGGAFLLCFLTLGVLCFLTARNLKLWRGALLAYICGGLSLFFMPFGTVLGISTFIVLHRPSVKAKFEAMREPA
ncbi:MAG: hypothetical protein JSS66_03085 [Armatimonadetes bacterium]|nr:hypothetical protein [Armatimonadota bacterium]